MPLRRPIGLVHEILEGILDSISELKRGSDCMTSVEPSGARLIMAKQISREMWRNGNR
jgi:hypothetical protein